MKEKEIMPVVIETLVTNLLDTKFSVWHRQPYRERLERMSAYIQECIRKYDAEYAKAHKNPNLKKRA